MRHVDLEHGIEQLSPAQPHWTVMCTVRLALGGWRGLRRLLSLGGLAARPDRRLRGAEISRASARLGSMAPARPRNNRSLGQPRQARACLGSAPPRIADGRAQRRCQDQRPLYVNERQFGLRRRRTATAAKRYSMDPRHAVPKVLSKSRAFVAPGSATGATGTGAPRAV